MKSILKTTDNFNKIDEFNTKMTLSLKDVAGQTLTVTKVAVGKDLDQDGKEVAAAALIAEEGIYGTISNTVIDLSETLIDIIDESGAVKVRVDSRRANNGRDYLALTLIG